MPKVSNNRAAKFLHLAKVRSGPQVVLLSAMLLFTTSCARHKIISAEELHSKLAAAISLAAETEAFLEIVRQGRTTPAFAQGHLQYLAAEANRSLKDFHESVPAPDIQAKFPDARTLVHSLAMQLTATRTALNDREALNSAQQHIAKIRQALGEIQSSL